jgi:hypothetical protein
MEEPQEKSENVSLNINKKTVKILIGALSTGALSYGIFDQFWLPYKKIQIEKSQEFVSEMKKLKVGINRVEYEVRLNTLVTSGVKIEDAVIQLRKGADE